MKKAFFHLVVIGLSVLCSCSVKEDDFGKYDVPFLHELTISASTSDMTRTSVLDESEKVLWDAEEQIMVFYHGQSAVFSSQNEERVDVTDFIGDLEYADGGKLMALYPYRSDAVCVNDTIITSLPSLQVGCAGSFSKNMNLTMAESNSPQMAFKNVGGGIRFTVQRDDITWVSIESIGEEPLAGRIKIIMENGVPVVKEIVDGNPRTALYAPDGQPFIPGQWYYVVMLPGTIQNGVRLVFHTVDGLSGEAVSDKVLTIERSLFLGKRAIDAEVASWGFEEPELKTDERSLTIEIPQGANMDYIRTLKLVNGYGEYPIISSSSALAPARQRRAEGESSVFYYSTRYKYAGPGYLLQFLEDLEGQMVMCSLNKPSEEEFEFMSGESTAIGILMVSPELLSDDPYELEATVATLREVPEYWDFVREVNARIEEALQEGKAPDYSDLNTAPVIYAILTHIRTDAVLSQQGIDVIPTRHTADSVYYKIRNHYRRVIHAYSEREWRTGTGVGHTKTEDVTFTLTDILNLMTDNYDKPKDPSIAGFSIDPDEYDDAMATLQSFDKDKSIDYPFPFFMVPESADYWKIVKGSWHWDGSEVKMIFENTSGEIGAYIKDADYLNVYTYGMGSMEDGYFDNATDQEKLRIIAAYLHGAINDFLLPLINLATGCENTSKALEEQHFRYDLRYGARKYPEWALILKLFKNLDKVKAWEKIRAAKNEGEVLEAIRYFVEYIGHQIVRNSDSDAGPHGNYNVTYYNLLYNIWKKYSGISATCSEFTDILKKSWNKGSQIFDLYSATVELSEAAVDFGGAIAAFKSSKAINKFQIPKDEMPSVKPIYPAMGGVATGNRLEFAWDMNLGHEVALHGVEYDLTFYFTSDVGSFIKTISNIPHTYYTLDLSTLQIANPNPTVKYEIYAHHPGSDGKGIARSGKVSVLFLAWQPNLSPVDMGLPLKWSSSNIGASSARDQGDYYAWGEKLTRSSFTWANYGLRSVDGSMKRYNAEDRLTTLLPDDDVVHMRQGGNWRMPTMGEWNDLINQCDWYPVTNVGGDRVIAYSALSKKTGNILYFPTGGFKKKGEVQDPSIPYYWSSSLTDGPDYTKARGMNEGQYNWLGTIYYGDDRYLGKFVRGVYDPTAGSGGEVIDIPGENL